jgi:hypothetical protein
VKKSVGAARLLAWLVPGAGHFYTGYKTKGITLFVLIGGLFVSGLMMKGGILTPLEDFISRLCMLGRVGAGLPWLAALFTNLRTGDMLSRYGEIGACYTAVAGLLNLLVVLSIREQCHSERSEESMEILRRPERIRDSSE